MAAADAMHSYDKRLSEMWERRRSRRLVFSNALECTPGPQGRLNRPPPQFRPEWTAIDGALNRPGGLLRSVAGRQVSDAHGLAMTEPPAGAGSSPAGAPALGNHVPLPPAQG